MRRLTFIVLAALVVQSSPADAGLGGDDWYRVHSDHFNILTNGKVEDVEELAHDLEIFRQSIILLTGVATTAEHDLPFTIIAPRNRGDFKDFFDQQWVVGVFAAGLRGMYAVIDMTSMGYDRRGRRSRNVDQVLKHEYVHFFLRNNSTVRYPYWYEEGFAEYLSTLEYEDGTLNVGYPVAGRHYSIGSTLTGKLPSLEALLSSTRRDRKVSTDMLYAAGWLLVHHLSTEPEFNDKVVPYLTLYNETRDSLGAFNAVFGMDLGKLKRQLDKKVQKAKYRYLPLPLMHPLSEPTVASELLPRRQALLALAEGLKTFRDSGDDLDDIDALYRDVLTETPDSPAALSGLASLALKRNDIAGAAGYVAQLPQETHDSIALIAKGDVALAQAFAGAAVPDEADTALLEQARAHYIAALKQNPNLADAFYGFGLSFFGSSGPDWKEPLYAFEQAHLLVPSAPDILAMRALILVQAGQFDEAGQWAFEVLETSGSEDLIEDTVKIAALAAAKDAEGGRRLALEIVKRNFSGKDD